MNQRSIKVTPFDPFPMFLERHNKKCWRTLRFWWVLILNLIFLSLVWFSERGNKGQVWEGTEGWREFSRRLRVGSRVPRDVVVQGRRRVVQCREVRRGSRETPSMRPGEDREVWGLRSERCDTRGTDLTVTRSMNVPAEKYYTSSRRYRGGESLE